MHETTEPNNAIMRYTKPRTHQPIAALTATIDLSILHSHLEHNICRSIYAAPKSHRRSEEIWANR